MKFFATRLFRLAVGGVSFLLMLSLSRSIWSVWKKWDIVRERQEALSRVEEENKQLQEELKEVQSPQFIEKEAREKLGLAKEGETVVIMPPRKDSGQANITAPDDSVPNWQRWWKLFF